jgi:ribonuclease HII
MKNVAHRIESQLLAAGIGPIAGVDEAGRGACAGPLVVVAVILSNPPSLELDVVRDSKELSESEREKTFEVIYQFAESISVIEIPEAEIDARGVHAANLDGMRRAIQGLKITPEYILTDGYAIEGLGIPSLGVWKGDQVVQAIGAASIVAKVTRDRIMRSLDAEYPQYGFASHKGYITAAHSKALKEHGPCEVHRRSFSNVGALLNKQ